LKFGRFLKKITVSFTSFSAPHIWVTHNLSLLLLYRYNYLSQYYFTGTGNKFDQKFPNITKSLKLSLKFKAVMNISIKSINENTGLLKLCDIAGYVDWFHARFTDRAKTDEKTCSAVSG
jgi:hypothetical protein